jgi:hypothetical protein
LASLSNRALLVKRSALYEIALRDQLLTELKDIGSAEEAANWAHRVLGAKNRLTTDDARQVEDAFQAKLATFGSAADIGEVPLSSNTFAPQPSSSVERRSVGSDGTAIADSIDKSRLAHPEPRRFRDKEHVKFVAKQPCLICGRRPADPHHLRRESHCGAGSTTTVISVDTKKKELIGTFKNGGTDYRPKGPTARERTRLRG